MFRGTAVGICRICRNFPRGGSFSGRIRENWELCIILTQNFLARSSPVHSSVLLRTLRSEEKTRQNPELVGISEARSGSVEAEGGVGCHDVL